MIRQTTRNSIIGATLSIVTDHLVPDSPGVPYIISIYAGATTVCFLGSQMDAATAFPQNSPLVIMIKLHVSLQVACVRKCSARFSKARISAEFWAVYRTPLRTNKAVTMSCKCLRWQPAAKCIRVLN